jgi:hypothetical protein
MTRRTDHSRLNRRDHMRERGSESINGSMPSGITIGSSEHRPTPSKSDLRILADRAFAEWTTRTSS